MTTVYILNQNRSKQHRNLTSTSRHPVDRDGHPDISDCDDYVWLIQVTLRGLFVLGDTALNLARTLWDDVR